MLFHVKTWNITINFLSIHIPEFLNTFELFTTTLLECLVFSSCVYYVYMCKYSDSILENKCYMFNWLCLNVEFYVLSCLPTAWSWSSPCCSPRWMKTTGGPSRARYVTWLYVAVIIKLHAENTRRKMFSSVILRVEFHKKWNLEDSEYFKILHSIII